MLRGLSKLAGFAGYVIQYGCWTHVTFEYGGDLVCVSGFINLFIHYITQNPIKLYRSPQCSGPSMEPTLHSNNVLLTEKVSVRRGHIERGDIIVARNPANPRQFICKRIVGMPGDTVVLHSALSAVNPFAGPTGTTTTMAIGSKPNTTGASLVPAASTSTASSQSTLDRRRTNNNLKRYGSSDPAEHHMETDSLNADDDDDGGGLAEASSLRRRLFRTNVVVVPRGHVWVEGDNAANSLDSRQYGPIPIGLVRSRAVGRVWPLQKMCVF